MRFARKDKAHTTPMASIIGRTGIDFVFLVEDMKLPSINYNRETPPQYTNQRTESYIVGAIYLADLWKLYQELFNHD